VLEVHVEVRVDQLVLDQLPDDASHLVAVQFDDSAGHLDLLHGKAFRIWGGLICPDLSRRGALQQGGLSLSQSSSAQRMESGAPRYETGAEAKSEGTLGAG